MTELCELYDISRNNDYKWVDRYLGDDPAGLEKCSRQPPTCPHRTPDYVMAAIVEARLRHPAWDATQKRVTNWNSRWEVV